MKRRQTKLRCPLCCQRVAKAAFREHVGGDCADAETTAPAKLPRLASSAAQTSAEQGALDLGPPKGRSESVLGLEPVARRLFRLAKAPGELCRLSKAFGATFAPSRRLCHLRALSKGLPASFKPADHPKLRTARIDKGRLREPEAWRQLRKLSLARVSAEDLGALLRHNGPALTSLSLGTVVGEAGCLDVLLTSCPKLARLRSLYLYPDPGSETVKLLDLAPDTLEHLSVSWIWCPSGYVPDESHAQIEAEVEPLAERLLVLLQRCTGLRRLGLPVALSIEPLGMTSGLGPKLAAALTRLPHLRRLACTPADWSSKLPPTSVQRLFLSLRAVAPMPDLSPMGPQLSRLSLKIVDFSPSLALDEPLEPLSGLGGLRDLSLDFPNSRSSWAPWLDGWTSLRKIRLRSFAIRAAVKIDRYGDRLHLNPEALEFLSLELYPSVEERELGGRRRRRLGPLELPGGPFPLLRRLELSGRPAYFAAVAENAPILFPVLRHARWEGGPISAKSKPVSLAARSRLLASRCAFAGRTAATELGTHVALLGKLATRAKDLRDLANQALQGLPESLRQLDGKV